MRKHYKESDVWGVMSKRGQVAIFVIVAIVIVAVVAALFFVPQTRVLLQGSQTQDPGAFMRSCMQKEFKAQVDSITSHGGSLNPSPSVLYQGEQVQYLCYTTENYIPCIVQVPLLVEHVQQQIHDGLVPTVADCKQQLVSEFQRRGYTVSSGAGDFNVSIIPGRISIDFFEPLTLTKETSQTFRSFSAAQTSHLYDLLSIATSIVDFESTLGDSETTLYIQYYPNLKIDKQRRDGDTIYTLSDAETKEEFRFATRSLVWPPGYGGQ